MSEAPEKPTPEEKEAWEKSLTAGSLPTWWKPDPAGPAAAGAEPPPALQVPPPPPPPPAAAPAPPPPATAAPDPPSSAQAAPAPAPEPLVKNAPPDWDHSRTASSLPTWWKSADPEAAAGPLLVAPAPPPVTAAPPPAAPTPPPAPPAHGMDQTVQLEWSAIEAAPAPAPPVPPVPPPLIDRGQQTMVMGTFPGASRTASVTVRSGPDAGARFALETSPLYVGRAADNGIVVNDPATSRRHARFEQRGQDYLVVDLGSANGTLVDGVQVVEQVLASGAVVVMGQNEFVVSIS